MAAIPMDVIDSFILPKLPVKSLLRFKCVSKSWETLISSPDFIHLHQRHSDSSDANRLLAFLGNSCTFRLYDLDSPLSPPSLFPYPEEPPNLTVPVDKFNYINIVASCEFFLLVSWTEFDFSRLILLNPSTRSYHEIPNAGLRDHRIIYGLCLDEANVDYKVLQIANDYDTDQHKTYRKVMIYSFKTNLWRIIECKEALDEFFGMGSSAVCVRKYLFHIIFRSNTDKNDIRICCFDIHSEQWTTDLRLPDNAHLLLIKFCVLDGLLCVLGPDSEEADTYCVWVMKEYGMNDSWVKLMKIAADNLWDPGYRPLAYRRGAPHELLCRGLFDCKFFWYNFKDEEATRAEIYAIPQVGITFNSDYICKGSLINFPGSKQIKLNGLKITPIIDKTRRKRRR